MSKLRQNIVATYCGNFWSGLMGLVFVPVYIHFLGVEAYGLIGIWITLQAILAVCDLGLNGTTTRELARLSVLPGKEQEACNLVRSVEVVCWCTAVAIGFVIIALSHTIARHWVTSHLPSETVENAVRLMGLAIALQWPSGLYAGGLLGLQRLILLNKITIGVGTLRGMGAALMLWWISPTLQVFFQWQIIISGLNTCLMAVSLWRALPYAPARSSFQMRRLAQNWQFTAGLAGTSVLGTILTQLDKIILSKILTLELFGYYAVAASVAMSLQRIVTPIFQAIYPRLTQMVSLSDEAALKRLYHEGCQLISVMMLPPAGVAAMFSYEIIRIWTQDQVTAERSHLVMTMLLCGTALNGLMTIPYALQLAHGWVRLALTANVIAILLLLPTMVIMVNHYGVVGAAAVWLILNSGYVLISIHFMHQHILPGEKWKWYGCDVMLPLTATLTTCALARMLFDSSSSQLATIVYLTVVTFLTASATVASTRTTRQWAFRKIVAFRRAVA